MPEFAITFQPSGRTVYVLPNTLALEAAARAGLAIQTPCGGRGHCGKCRVRFGTSPPEPLPADRKALTAEQLADGWRLACQHPLDREVELHVPPESVYGTAEQILTADATARIEIQPAVRRQFVRLEPPTLEDPRDDLTRLRDALAEAGGSAVRVPAPLLRRLPGLLRDSDWAVTVTLADGRVVDLAPGRLDAAPLGAAFDIGTTTIVGTLMDLADGRELAVTARINPQVAFGDDVVSRILLCREQPDGVARLHEAVLDATGEMLAELADESGVRTDQIYELSVAGNTTMQLLFVGVSPGPLGAIPFAPPVSDGMLLDADELPRLAGAMHPNGRVYVLPSIGGFLGGDTVAGLMATNLHKLPGNSMLIDIGTNGEIVLASGGRMWAASTAAGPAFEGARIGMGMRAAPGAIEKVIIPPARLKPASAGEGPVEGDGDVQVNVIGNVRPVGLCGTALIDAAAGLLDAGLLDTTGRLVTRDKAPARLPRALADRITGAGGDARFVLARGGTGRPAVALTQRDIRELQLAGGAIRAGMAILLARAGLSADQLDAILLAGAFGNYIRRENARRIGLLPDVPIERIHFVGNAASMGAKLALMSTGVRRSAQRVARAVEHETLTRDADFQARFVEAMIFPAPS